MLHQLFQWYVGFAGWGIGVCVGVGSVWGFSGVVGEVEPVADLTDRLVT